jgi:hypothetical protein
LIGLFFAKEFEHGTKSNITYVLAALAAVNAIVIATFSFKSLQIHELKQFQTKNSTADCAERQWEFNWRRDPTKSVLEPVKRLYYGMVFWSLGTISAFLITASILSAESWCGAWAGILAAIMHLIPLRLIHQERQAEERWSHIQEDLNRSA